MRKNCTPGSVRGAARKGGSYRGGRTSQNFEKTRMKINLSRPLLFLLVLVALPVFGQARDPVHHSSDPILFEIIEDGVISNKRVSLEFDANEVKGTKWAECRITIITINNDKKRIELYMYYASTERATIRNLDISSKAISFEMIPFPLAPDRPLRFVATRQGEMSHLYQANAVGLWKGLFDETKLLKAEWRQVPSIALPFPTIGK